ncbi:MAG: PQQ-binding-like beta-propeller repeat protein [Vicinamibacterales bacterium]
MMRAALIPAAVALAGVLASSEPRPFRPVTDATLKSPSPNDWIAWRGTSRSDGYSPLTQITRANVAQLQPVWAWTMEPGTQQATPLVYDGVMYLPNPGGILQALDAGTGDLLWEYRAAAADTPRSTGVARGLALYADKVFMSWGADVIAVDARTGKEVWRAAAADRDKGFRLAAGPVAAHGTIVVGLSSCGRFIEEKCAIVGFDAATGKERWRTPTIAGAADAGNATWGNVDPLYRSGTEMWISGSYDPDLNLVYWSTAQAKPWTRFARGTDGDALYSNTTLALNPDTGRIVWHRQTLPGETHDLDEVFESVLVDAGGRASLFKMGKMGILWEIDRRTGRILHASDLGFQNLVMVDPATGAVRYREEKLPKPGQPMDLCPGSGGVRNWPSMAYSIQTRTFYVPFMTACATQTFTDVEKRPGGGGLGMGPMQWYLPPRSEETLGGLMAIDASGKVLWQHRTRAPFSTAALATAGGLVFAGTYDRHFFAFDAKTGQVLWQVRAPTSVQGFPISYGVRGRQYIAMPAGTGGSMLEPGRLERLIPDVPRPRAGNTITVFALPR